jgi:hypothetical protein
VLDGARVDLGELSLVGTPPDALVQAAVGEAAASGLPFVALLDAAPSAFAHLGFAPCLLQHSIALPMLAGAAPALRLACQDDAEDVAALADTLDLPLAPARVAPDWRWLLEAPEGWLVLEDGRGRAVAYAALDAAGAVVEAAAADAGVARQLVAALANHGIRLLQLSLAHPVARAALLLGGDGRSTVAPAHEPSRLWGVVDLLAALEQLAPALTRRLAYSRYAGWSGVVRLEGEAGEATLHCQTDRVKAEVAGGPTAVLISGLGLSAAAQLLLGYRAAADLRATGELRCADVDLGLLNVLFPTR